MSSAGLPAGTMVSSRYRIDALIGEGGFGEVYRATELKLDRAVALKMLRPEIMGREDVQGRFQREAQLVKSFDHPNTVRLLDFGQADDGTPYIVYELLRGQALDELLHVAGPLPPTRVARITMQVLKSLMEAHEHEVVHRDIKPSNIFVCEFTGEKDFVKVLDFGIAKADPNDQAKITKMGMAIGTPSYMAPEQVHGVGVGPATDLYALGLVMAEALTGQTIVHAASPAETALLQASDKAISLPAVVLQSSLGPVVQRAVNKAIDRRYKSAAEMLEAIQVLNVVDGAAPQLLATSERGLATRQAGGMAVQPTQAAATGYTPGVAPAAVPPTQPQAPATMTEFGPTGHPHTPSHPPQTGAYAADPYQRTSGYGYQQQAPYGSIAPPAKSGGSSCGIIAVLMGLASLAVIALLIGVAVLVAGRGKGGGEDDRPQETSTIDSSVGDLTAKSLKRRIKADGWSVTNETISNNPSLNLVVYSVRKGTAAGAIQLYKYEDESSAVAVADSMRQQDFVFRREDGTILIVTIAKVGGNQKKVSRRVLSDLLK